MKKLLIISILLFVLCAIGVYGASCLTLTSGKTYSFSDNVTLCANQKVTLNITTISGGAITLNAHNITLDCNNSIIRGNRSGYGITASGKRNLTLKNCNLINFSRDFFFSGSKKIFLYNNTFGFNRLENVFFDTNHTIVQGNKFNVNETKGTLVYYYGRSNNATIKNNLFKSNYSTASYAILIDNASSTYRKANYNFIITNNQFKNYAGLKITNVHNITINNNIFNSTLSFLNSAEWTYIIQVVRNFQFKNNNLINKSFIYFQKNYNVTIQNNSFNNLNQTNLAIIYLMNTSKIQINNNYLTYGNKTDYKQIKLDNCSKYNISNNILKYGYIGIQISYNSKTGLVFNNSADCNYKLGTHGVMLVYNVYKTNVTYNTVNNCQFGILNEWRSNNNLFYRNTINEAYSQAGYDLHNTQNATFKENIFNCRNSSTPIGFNALDNATGTKLINNTYGSNCLRQIAVQDKSRNISIMESRQKSISIFISNSTNTTIANSLSNFTVYYGQIYTSPLSSFNYTYTGNKYFRTLNSSHFVWNRTRFVMYNLSAEDKGEIRSDPTKDKLPFRGLVIARNSNLTKGKFPFLNDSSTNGLIIINSKVTLNCNNATITQRKAITNSKGLYINVKSNLTVYDCNFGGFANNVYMFNGRNQTIKNSKFYNSSSVSFRTSGINSSRLINLYIRNSASYGIWSAGKAENILITNSTIINATESIYLEGRPTRINITNNFINKSTLYGIDCFSNCSNLFIKRNRIFNSATTAILLRIGLSNIVRDNYLYNSTSQHLLEIRTPVNYTLLYNNTVLYSGRNGIRLQGKYNNVSFNHVSYSGHHGIDMRHDNANANDGSYNRIFNNTVLKTNTSLGIYLETQSNNRIYGNLVEYRIQVGGNKSWASTNFVYNNRVINGNSSFYSTGNNTIWENNTIVSKQRADYYDIKIGAYVNDKRQSETSIFKNIFDLVDNKIEISVLAWNNATTQFINITPLIDLTSSNSARYIYLEIRDKSFRIKNNTFNTTKFYPFNSYCNSTVAPCRNNSAGTVKETIPANGRVVIVGYSDNNQPRIDNLALTAILTYWSWSPNVLTVYSSGTGNSYITNMTKVSSLYYVTKNGVTIETNTLNDYLFTSANWQWADYGTLPLSVASPVSRVIMDVLVILIGLVMLAFVAQPLKDYQSMTTGEWLKFFIFALIVVVMMVILVQQISII